MNPMLREREGQKVLMVYRNMGVTEGGKAGATAAAAAAAAAAAVQHLHNTIRRQHHMRDRDRRDQMNSKPLSCLPPLRCSDRQPDERAILIPSVIS